MIGKTHAKKFIASLWAGCFGCSTLVPSAPAPRWVTIFAHGLGGNAEQRHAYQPYIGGEIVGENGPEAAGGAGSCLGQQGDIDVVKKQLNDGAHADKMVVLSGVSKGAATVINTVGDLAVNDPAVLSWVRVVFAESPFARPENVASQIVQDIARQARARGSALSSTAAASMELAVATPSFDPIARRVIQSRFPPYDPAGITPIKSVIEQWKHVPNKDMVVVLLHSKEDVLISINDSRRLYIELRKLGFRNTYLIEASYGVHANVLWDRRNSFTANDQHVWLMLSHIYRKHGLPCRVRGFEAKGQDVTLDVIIQPSIETVKARINPPKSCVIS